ncbi:MAG TPA: hypothetical protein VGK10_19385 [Prolixibacteraceae bacterium]|jgi:hypothetical protein
MLYFSEQAETAGQNRTSFYRNPNFLDFTATVEPWIRFLIPQIYTDFGILFRLLHVSRMPHQQEDGTVSIIDNYHLEGGQAGASFHRLGLIAFRMAMI